MKGMKNEDLDIGINGGVSGHNSYTHFYSDNSKLTGSENLIRRIHGIINFERLNGEFPYKVRDGKEPPDPLFARIESEPVHDGKGLKQNADGTYTRIVGTRLLPYTR